MARSWFRHILSLCLYVHLAWSQDVIHLKTRDLLIGPDTRAHFAGPLKRRSADRSHYLVKLPAAADLNLLAQSGVVVTGSIPGSALAVAAGDGMNWEALGATYAGRLQASDKVSPAIRGDEAAFVVEFHRDVDMNQGRELLVEHGLTWVDHEDLLPNQLVVEGEVQAIFRLAEWDEVAYIFPASEELRRGAPVRSCVGPLTEAGMIPQYARIGAGWPRINGVVAVSYAFSALTQKLPSETARAEIVRGLSEWTRYANIRLTSGGSPGSARTIDILFARGSHGDAYPFDGAGRALAHTFYPAPPNPEPIAGDMHFDEDESWRVGASIDLYSVALHEAGHALGLGHSDQPGAVMYPYYQMVSTLAEDDIAGIRSLYGAPESGQPANPAPGDPPTPAPAAPPVVAITFPAGSTGTSAASISLQGTASGGTGALRITWSSNRGGGGLAAGANNWSIASVPLLPGDNGITVTATDEAGRAGSAIIMIQRTIPSDTTPPSIRITSPSATIVSTTGETITISGTASDNTGVSAVTWTNSTGASGNAIGTTFWAIPMPLRVGTNSIVVRAFDAAGNSAWRSITVARR